MRPLIVGLILVMSACAGDPLGETATEGPTVSTDPTPNGEEAAPRPSPHADLATAKPSPEGTDGDLVVGVLGADAVEGGCAYLQSGDGVRYEVIYPEGWQIRASPLELTDPSGRIVATGGETITVRGRETADMMSICQIGPIFEAAEVVSID